MRLFMLANLFRPRRRPLPWHEHTALHAAANQRLMVVAACVDANQYPPFANSLSSPTPNQYFPFANSLSRVWVRREP